MGLKKKDQFKKQTNKPEKVTTGVVQWKRGGELEGRQNEEDRKLAGRWGRGGREEPARLEVPESLGENVVLFL